MPCKVDSISHPAPDIAILRLRLPPDSHFNYLPGQYVELIHGTTRRSYSIANCPATYQGIELHLRNIPGGVMSRYVFGQLHQDKLLYLEGPQGTFFVRDGSGPIIFLAGGTGFAPVKAMVEQLLLDGSRRELFIYWGNSSVSGFYSDLPQRWQDEHANISYVPVLSGDEGSWSGRRGLVHKAVLEDFGDLSEYAIYACGAPAMVEAARDEFIAMGAKPDTFFFDSFTPSS